MEVALLEQPAVPSAPLADRAERLACMLLAEAYRSLEIYAANQFGFPCTNEPRLSRDDAEYIVSCATACGVRAEENGNVWRIV